MLAFLVLSAATILGGDPASGPAVGDKLGDAKIKGVYDPIEGKEINLLDRAKKEPTVLVFVQNQKITRPAYRLLKKLHETTSKHEGLHAAFVWVTDDAEETEKWLKLAKGSLGLDGPVGISVDGKAGPNGYGLNDMAIITIVLAKDAKVTATFAYADPNETVAAKIGEAIEKLVAQKAKDGEPKFDPKSDPKSEVKSEPKKTLLPDGTERISDISYVPGGHERNVLDLYLPKSEKPTPLVVWIHGGGWTNGSKANPPLLGFTKTGFALASINYRFSQHAIFPAQAHDAFAAIRYLRANAKKYNIDPDRIGVAGASAGGHLSALVGTASDVKDVTGTLGEHPDVSNRVQAVFDLFGPADFLLFGTENPKALDSRLLGGLAKDNVKLAKAASPVEHVTKDDPPFLIIHGDKDQLVPINQSEKLDAALKTAGVEVNLIRIEGAGHGGLQFATPAMQRSVLEFFQKHLTK